VDRALIYQVDRKKFQFDRPACSQNRQCRVRRQYYPGKINLLIFGAWVAQGLSYRMPALGRAPLRFDQRAGRVLVAAGTDLKWSQDET